MRLTLKYGFQKKNDTVELAVISSLSLGGAEAILQPSLSTPY